MIQLKVISLQGAPVAQPVSAEFGPNGGTIGRSATNTLVLDDRTVSRVHAQVECRDGRYVIIDRGSNPLHHNGLALGTGREAVLGPGDRLQVGSFELSVQASKSAMPPSPMRATVRASVAAVASASPPPSSDDPFADLLAGLGSSASSLQPAAAAAPAGAARKQTPVEPSLFPDPMGLGAPMIPASSPASADDPFADLLGPGESSAGGAGIPAGFADLGLRPNSPAIGIDNLFGGIGGAGGHGSDPIPESSLPTRPPEPGDALIDNPFEAVQGRRKPSTPTRDDHLPIEHFGFTPPKVVSSPPPGGGRSGGGLLDDLGIDRPPAQGARFDDMSGQPIAAPRQSNAPDDDPFADLLPATPPAAASRAAAPPPPVAPPPPPRAAAPIAAPSPAVAPSVRQRAPAASDDALLTAFLRGLGTTQQMPTELTPELMERIGVLLRGATDGTLQLLQARRDVKQGMHADLTRIEASANNPLKLSPTAEVALPHLLGPGMRGFMGPEEAMRDAWDDLRAHQFGVMAGMKAALAHVLSRFTPAELENKIAAKSKLDALFAANRKARLWDQFVALYGGIAAEVEDDFNILYEKAFVKAYNEQMSRLKSGGR
ncbi:type VI secretion system-associated FHA domain protein TagH [Variovorax sp. J22R133]|uniref:type VI secretion system-associated FHA domain protein TagH n=1 Tax=Variovorax brevis TaxID=3053503 RepID=UPI002579177B|nr:type VI secretion system-associated FHA domain protein TagH [Variovorax sp. J22R133]MDM0117226.1 type VI secretion system-associated FHA domain protein TagH [Variovorax sp. J22R133]